MKTSFFKPRKPFSFSAHPYDIGTFTGLWHSHDDNHFLLKVYNMDENKFSNYYSHHLKFAIENNLLDEKDFFHHVWHIIQNRIRHYEMQDPFSSSHATHKQSVEKLKQFQKYLKSIDKWNARPAHIIIDEKENIIQQQKKEIETLTRRLNELKVYEVSQKGRIEKGYVATVIDLLKQMEKLQVPSGNKLMKSDYQVLYPRMIGKYFTDGGDDISVETMRNYYVGNGGDVTSKGTAIRPDHKLFKIVLSNSTKK